MKMPAGSTPTVQFSHQQTDIGSVKGALILVGGGGFALGRIAFASGPVSTKPLRVRLRLFKSPDK